MLKHSVLVVVLFATAVGLGFILGYVRVPPAAAVPAFRAAVRPAMRRLPHAPAAAEPVRRAVSHDGVSDPERVASRRARGKPG